MSGLLEHVIVEVPFKLTGKRTDPTELDYDLYGLHKKRIFNGRGELNAVEYYRNYDGITYSDLVLKEYRTYLRDPGTGWVIKRDLSVEWYCEDDTVGATKATVKFYTMQESYDEGKTRRGNVINNASIALLGYTGEANGIDFLNGCAVEIDLYIKGSVQPLIDKVAASTQPYMLSGSPCVRDIVNSILEAGR